MSNTQYAFLQKNHVPNRQALQAAIDALGFDLQLDPEFTPFEDEGFSPCVLFGEQDEDVGFEIFYQPAADIVEDDEDFQRIAGERDYCISMIVSAALAKDFAAVVLLEGDRPDPLKKLLSEDATAVQDPRAGNVTPAFLFGASSRRVCVPLGWACWRDFRRAGGPGRTGGPGAAGRLALTSTTS